MSPGSHEGLDFLVGDAALRPDDDDHLTRLGQVLVHQRLGGRLVEHIGSVSIANPLNHILGLRQLNLGNEESS